ncbi:DinB family protein [Hymenobacter yonginensis]|uniref:DinB family protein n=1 Tax=Hymenobacter yonginensis TaxID=748197 RepID=A0ABY7PM15_9BACT|nr:DinB family protein [Hymenobacter yonginensis]WBO83754.1 DinB family protein [Hymenobacter yonginensis]
MLDLHPLAAVATHHQRHAATAPGLVGTLQPRRRGRRRRPEPATGTAAGSSPTPTLPPAEKPLAEALARLQHLLDLLNHHFPDYDELELSRPLQPGGWSRRQLLGHLLDSATNNYQRFVLCQLGPEPFRMVSYQQDGWVACGAYQTAPAAELLQLWTLYNRQLARLLAQFTPASLQHRCEFENGYTVTLGWVVEDYVVHMEHHIRQIIG